MTRLLLLTLFVGCTAEITTVEPEKPDLVLITLDTTRADRIGAYGDPLARTPNLDKLAKSSALFREAFTTVPLTLPAHASILTGLYPKAHGLRDNASGRLNEEVPALAQTLKDNGYSTGAFVGSYVLDSSRGLGRGFDTYHDAFHPQDLARASKTSDVERPAREVVQAALGWWEKTEGPRFLWVHLFDAHRPYTAPDGWKGDPYRGEIFSMDRALHPLFASLPDTAAVVVVGDHGENLWDGGELEHGVVLTRSTLRVPLIIRPPKALSGSEAPSPKPGPSRPPSWTPVEGIGPDNLQLDPVADAPRAAKVVSKTVSIVDITPTILGWLDLACVHCEGRSLTPAIQGEPFEEQPVYAETVYPAYHYGWAPSFAETDGDWLLIESPNRSTFRPKADPYWQTPVSDTAPKALGALLNKQKTDWETKGATLDADTLAQLKALGYATESAPPPSGPRPNPKDKISVLNRLFVAQGKMKSDPAAAEAELKRLLADEPNLLDGHYSLAMIYINKQEGEAALKALERVLQQNPRHTQALQSKAYVLRNLGRLNEAHAILVLLITYQPHEVRWHHLAVDLHGRKKDFVGIRDACRKGLVQHPQDPFLHYMLGLAFIQLDAPAQALKSLNQAEEYGTRAKDLALWQGRAHELLGNLDQAIEAFHKDAKNRPDDVRPVGAAGRLLAKQKKCGEALPFLLKAIERGMKDTETVRAYRECGGQGF